MKKEHQAYIDKINEYLNDNTGFRYSLSRHLNDVFLGIDHIVQIAGDQSPTSKDVLADYRALYEGVYRNFQIANIKASYPGLSEEQEAEKKVKNTAFFHAVMKNVFEQVIAPEIQEKCPDFKFKPAGYLYGGMGKPAYEKEDYALGFDTGENYLKNFRKAYSITNTPHFSELKNAMESVTAAMRESDSPEKTETYFRQYASGISMLREHYEERSWFSQWLTTDGWRERSLINNAKENLLQAVKPEHLSVIKVPGKTGTMPLSELSASEAKEALDLYGQTATRNPLADLIGQKISDYRDYVKDKSDTTKGHLMDFSEKPDPEEQWVHDEDLLPSEEDIRIDKEKAYEKIQVPEGKKVPELGGSKELNQEEEMRHKTDKDLYKKLDSIMETDIDHIVKEFLTRDEGLKAMAQSYKAQHEAEKKEFKERSTAIKSREKEKLTEEEKKILKEDKAQLRQDIDIGHDMNPLNLNQMDDARKNIEVDLDDLNMDDEITGMKDGDEPFAEEDFLTK